VLRLDWQIRVACYRLAKIESHLNGSTRHACWRAALSRTVMDSLVDEMRRVIVITVLPTPRSPSKWKPANEVTSQPRTQSSIQTGKDHAQPSKFPPMDRDAFRNRFRTSLHATNIGSTPHADQTPHTHPPSTVKSFYALASSWPS
jgi:hypothetical protein